MAAVETTRDSRTGVIVHSLYGSSPATLTPTSAQLQGLDVLVFDVQDVGARYYTFPTTMLYAMKAAASVGLRMVVLDRPNPLGGEVVEGPTLRPGYESFVGPHALPIRHGMTVGELARLYAAEVVLDVELEIVTCPGWHRSMTWLDTGRSWVMPSPNMPSPDTALVYPGACLIEGTNLSEGRGTTRPFELCGSPWLDSEKLLQALPEIDGALLRPCAFRPTFHKHARELCLGLQPHVWDPGRFRSVSLYTRLIAAARDQDPERFDWRRDAYEFVTDPIAIDLLYGSNRERMAIESGVDVDEILDTWKPEEAEFRARRRTYLLYD
jgi:uncharacterized protein YbbC (DUF1343 family)